MKKLFLLLLILALFLTGCSTPPPEENDNVTPNDEPKAPIPATQITNEGQPQDENDDFLFVFKGISGYFARGERLELEIEIINNTGETHEYIGYDAFSASPSLYCINNGETYVLNQEPGEMTGDSSHLQIEHGGSEKNTYCYKIPEDAPLGEYTLTCFYNGFRKDFEGYFTLTQ